MSKVLQNALWSILQYFRPSLSYQLLLRPLLCLFLSGRFTQVLLYIQTLDLLIIQYSPFIMLCMSVHRNEWCCVNHVMMELPSIYLNISLSNYLANQTQIFMWSILSIGQCINDYGKCSLISNTKLPAKQSLDKQCNPRSDCFRVFPVCYFDNHFVNSSPENQHFESRKRKVLKILEQLPYVV